MKKLIEFTINWKYRNLLHIVLGILLCIPHNILLTLANVQDVGFVGEVIMRVIPSFALMNWIGSRWEHAQVKYFNAPYSVKDVTLGIVGGMLISLIFIL